MVAGAGDMMKTIVRVRLRGTHVLVDFGVCRTRRAVCWLVVYRCIMHGRRDI